MLMSRSVHHLARFAANKCRSLNTCQLRGIARVVNGSQHVMAGRTAPSVAVMSRRFAANSPQIDEELTQFLKSEIELEKKSATNELPTIKGWTTTADGSNVTFAKTYGSEQISVRANINHSVDTKDIDVEDPSAATNPNDLSAQMVCRPDFAVEIKKGDQVLGINCSFVDLEEHEDELDDQQSPPGAGGQSSAAKDMPSFEDEFQINELSIYEGDFKDSSYLVSGDVMDGSMYDLMMDLLHERGVDQEFTKSLIEFATLYDHRQYVGLLEKLRDFVAKK